MTTYYKGDDYDAFDQEWAEVDFDCPEDWVVSRAEIRIGNLPVLIFPEPIFPFPLSLSSAQTSALKDTNKVTMAVYDTRNRKQTVEGSWTFVAHDREV